MEQTKEAVVEPDHKDHTDHKKKMIDRIFPPKYDFHGMLCTQAELTVKAIEAFVVGLREGKIGPTPEFKKYKDEADNARWHMEDELILAFSTPFDRTDIYDLSRQMDRIIDSASDTTKEMVEFDIDADEPIIAMTDLLLKAVKSLSEAIHLLVTDPAEAEDLVPPLRKLHKDVERSYLDAISFLLRGEVTMDKIKRKEVYHNFKNVMKNVGFTVDILHRVVVSLI
jgi:uncharacterized protein Yka (UPF0111/DUF47 family)